MTDSWYYTKRGEQVGPMPFHQLASELKALEYWEQEYVWRPGFGTWVRASSVPELYQVVPQFLTRRPVPPTQVQVTSERWSILKFLILTAIIAAILVALIFLVRHGIQYLS